MDAPRILVRDAAGFSGVWREVHFEEWTKPGDVTQMKTRFGAQHAWLTELPAERKIVTVSVVRDKAIGPLEGEARVLIGESVKRIAPHVKGGAIVVQAAGFKGAVFRSIVATLTLFSGARYDTKTEATIEAALRWVATLLDEDGGRKPSYDELLAAWHALVQNAARD